ncbi:hypothetical protein K474DRAFT_1662850 [Panus rudis PR-1116 ss-1]|nr:hypothetical protein K474DRAFT_1662850 [Panus rudis PR-1116 ss-1]
MAAKLRAFTSKHRPIVAESAIRALELYRDVNRAKTHVLMIFLRSRPGSRRAETSFYVTGADVVPISTFPPDQRKEMEGQLKQAHDMNVRSGQGMIGALFAILLSLDSGVSNVAPVGFDRSVETMLPEDWKERMMLMMNEGIVR